MGVPVKVSRVRDALRPRLGSAIVDGTAVPEALTGILRGYTPYGGSLSELSDALSNRLFSELFGLLGPGMAVTLDDGRTVRVRLETIPEIADDALYALLDALVVSPMNGEALREHAMRGGSLSAMRVLLAKYVSSMSDEEKALLERIIADRTA